MKTQTTNSVNSIPFANNQADCVRFCEKLIGKYKSISAIKAKRNLIQRVLKTDFAGYQKILKDCQYIVKNDIRDLTKKAKETTFSYDNILKVSYLDLRKNEYYAQLCTKAGLSPTNVSSFVSEYYPYINDLTGEIMMQTRYISANRKFIYSVLVTRPADKFNDKLALSVLQKSLDCFGAKLEREILGRKVKQNKFAENSLMSAKTAIKGKDGLFAADADLKVTETILKTFVEYLKGDKLESLQAVNKAIRTENEANEANEAKENE